MSLVGPKPTCRDVRDLGTIGRKADITLTSPIGRIRMAVESRRHIRRDVQKASVGCKAELEIGGIIRSLLTPKAVDGTR